MAKKRPLVLVHGYSDQGESYLPWCVALKSAGYDDPALLNVCTYESLTNEVTIKDLGEAFERALRLQAHLDPDEGFDAIVHSTGMLVVRAWLTGRDPSRVRRLKHLVALAPATFGSPLAHKGRSTLGSLFRGNRRVGPDFLEAGDRILDGLELASRFQWELTHQDVFGSNVVYGDGADTPWVFTFCGTQPYEGLRRAVHDPGTDGTVRWAGCSLTTRKVVMDLTQRPSDNRVRFEEWRHVASPTVLVPGLNHSTIVSAPPQPLVGLVMRALEVESHADYQAWEAEADSMRLAETKRLAAANQLYQQFIVRAVDERADPVPDYHVEVFTRQGGRERVLEAFDADPHPYRADRSLRCFHVNLSKILAENLESLWLRVLVSSGTTLVGYYGYGSTMTQPDAQVVQVDAPAFAGDGSTELEIDLSEHLPTGPGTDFFTPFTTTLVEIKFDREPYPLTGATRLLRWIDTANLLGS